MLGAVGLITAENTTGGVKTGDKLVERPGDSSSEYVAKYLNLALDE